MLNLKESTQKIEKINTLIDEITQQINILSLNASIEASRAGEQGKGFSAVAMEIRKLAENTRRSTEGIYSTVETIKNLTNNTTEAMEKVVELVREIKEQINKQDTSTSRIAEAVFKINDGMKVSFESIKKTGNFAEELSKLSKNLQKLI